MELLFAIILFAVVSSITPGPNNIMLMSSGLNFGIKRSLPHFFGICFGFPLMVLSVGLLIGPFFVRFPLLHQIIKIFSVSYILYLAWHIARSHQHIESIKPKKPLKFWQALLFQWINPTAWGLGVGGVAAYATADNSVVFETILISMVFLVICFPTAATWMCFGSAFKYILKKESHRRCFNLSMSALLVLSITLVFVR